MRLEKLKDGARFRTALGKVSGTLVSKSLGCATVEWDRNETRKMHGTLPDGEPFEREFLAGARRVTIALATEVEEI